MDDHVVVLVAVCDIVLAVDVVGLMKLMISMMTWMMTMMGVDRTKKMLT